MNSGGIETRSSRGVRIGGTSTARSLHPTSVLATRPQPTPARSYASARRQRTGVIQPASPVLFASALASRKGAGNAHHSEKELVIKRIALGLAIAAFAAPVAQAGGDQGIGVPRSSSTNAYEPFVTDFPSCANVGDASAYDLIEVVRSTPSAVPSDLI